MLSLLNEMITVVEPFAPVFRKRVWECAKVLVVNAMLVPNQCTIAWVLRVMGLSQARISRMTIGC